MSYVPKFCEECGEDLAEWNESGYCSRTPECRRKGQLIYRGKSPDTEIRACLNCGEHTQSRDGYCRRTDECSRLREQARHEARYNARPAKICPGCGGQTRSETGFCSNSPECRAAKHMTRKRQCLEAYGGAVCACCGETRIYFLTLDHVNGDGAEDRKLLFAGGKIGSDGRPRGNQYQALKARGYPDRDRYQVLCMNCNFAKRTSAVCPCSLERKS